MSVGDMLDRGQADDGVELAQIQFQRVAMMKFNAVAIHILR